MRIILNIALFFSVLFLPWLVTVTLGFAAVFAQKNFYEILIWGLVYDLMYHTAMVGFFEFNFFFTLGAFVILYGAEFLKKKTRFY